MARQGDITSMGGPDERFVETHWSVLDQTRAASPTQQREAVGRIVQQYWKPVYCYLRRKGHTDDAAKDLTQGFFHEIAINQRLLQRANPAKGRFRSLLLTALDRYVVSVHRAAHRKKRMPEKPLLALDRVDWRIASMPAEPITPHQTFVYAWARDLLEQVLAELQLEYRRKQMDAHWDVFHARIVEPILHGTACPSLAELCEAHGLADAKQASNMIVTVRRRFQTLLRNRVRPGVASAGEVDGEIRELMDILSRPGAGFSA